MTENMNKINWFQVLRHITHRIDDERNRSRDDPGVCVDADVWAEAQNIIKEEINKVFP